MTVSAPVDATRVPDLWTDELPRGRGGWIAAVVALAVHAGLAGAVVTINPARFHAEVPVEIDVEEKLPPPEIKPPTPEPPREAPRPRAVVKRAPAPREVPPPPEAAPPPPSREPPKTEAPPSFGVSLSSTVAGDQSGVSVPVGSTLLTKPKVGSGGTGSGNGAGGEGTHPFTPVSDIYVGTQPEKIFEVNSDQIYPPEAKRMGIEGAVKAKVGIDETGKVVEVKIIERAGHGFDEAALKAMWKLRFKPARTNDGRAVPYRIEYTYNFNLTQ